MIRDPKERGITTPCFNERVLLHAIMNVCEPVVECRFNDLRLLELLNRINASYRAQFSVGQPNGCLTSQHFANFYLGWLDRFVKESLRVRRYVRYMDDMVRWHSSREARVDVHARCCSMEEIDVSCRDQSS